MAGQFIMKVKYPFTGIIPSLVVYEGGSYIPPGIRVLTILVSGVSGYARARERGSFPYASALTYIDSAFSLIPILYDHYESIPDIYFTYLNEAKETLFSNPPEMPGDVERRIECLNKIFLISQLAIENNHPNKEGLLEDMVVLRKEINLNIYGAVKMRDKAYLSRICRKQARETVYDTVNKKFTQLADKYQKEDLEENPKHHAKKKSLIKGSKYRQRNHSSSPTYFKPQSPKGDSESNRPLLKEVVIQPYGVS